MADNKTTKTYTKQKLSRNMIATSGRSDWDRYDNSIAWRTNHWPALYRSCTILHNILTTCTVQATSWREGWGGSSAPDIVTAPSLLNLMSWPQGGRYSQNATFRFLHSFPCGRGIPHTVSGLGDAPCYILTTHIPVGLYLPVSSFTSKKMYEQVHRRTVFHKNTATVS